jgi:branched-chain amino acid transport system permease protein
VLVTNGFAQPNEFGVILSLQILIGAAVAGLGSLWGTIFGALFIGLLPEISTSVPLVGSNHGQDVIFGLIVILIMIALPNGVAGLLLKIDSRVKSAIKSDPTAS